MMFSNIHKQTSPFMLSKKTQQQNNDNNSTKSTYKAPAPVMFGFSKQYLAANRVQNTERILAKPSPPVVVSDGTKMKWGKPIWTFFHLLAHKVKESEFNVIRPHLLNTIYSICSVLPCPVCSEHAKRYLQAINFNNIRTKQDLKQMICNFHNDVNKRKGYVIFNSENLDETYDKMNLVDSINQFIFHFEDKHRSAKLMADDMMRKQTATLVKKWIKDNIQSFTP
jgi:hypothetical protein